MHVSRVFAMCPALRGSTVSYAGDAHFPKHSLEYSLNFRSQSKKKVFTLTLVGMKLCMLHHNSAILLYIHDFPMLQLSNKDA